jgi:hypothetical protein
MYKLVTDEASRVLNRSVDMPNRIWKRENGMKAQRSQVHFILTRQRIDLPIMRRIIGKFSLRHAENCRRAARDARCRVRVFNADLDDNPQRLGLRAQERVLEASGAGSMLQDPVDIENQVPVVR